MCGILAILYDTPPKKLTSIVNQTCPELSERGPDHKGIVTRPNGTFIFHRLAINDTSQDGSQPMTKNNIVMMCNGEIYNHRELEATHNINCKSKSDCEVILHLFEKIGFVPTVKSLYGVYALVISNNDSVFLARDRIGVRPLFVGFMHEKTLLISSVPNAITPWCHTIIPILPGSCVTYSRFYNELYITHTDEVQIPKNRISNGMVALQEALINAVQLRLMTDRPIGCLLSGGLDSSIIAALLVKFLGNNKVRTYSIGMKGSTDLFYAKKVADFLHTDHHEILFTPKQGLEAIPRVIKALASYDITTVRASVGMFLLAEYISQHTKDKVIFSGEGSDEILEGYLYFHNAPTPEEAEEESLRLVQNLYLYDVLRADRCVSRHGLELRVPFLDRRVIDTVMSIPAKEKCPQKGIEKYILRKAFEGYLPDEILYRRKEAFSDGVSSLEKSWFTHISEYAENLIPDFIFNSKFPSKEAMYYKLVFDNIFPNYNLEMNYWLPKWCGDIKDPSARTLKVYKS